ncbi:hypothetical protein L210DRAFT_3564313 [Boletus edulis BED1]|uniref:FAD-binding FR-type domain-containing protein n=1 Tax=Boletus edulis BED1 TaxID=1328754 RepID=A0AAD4BFX3_BOLED|nr:hypothetical protein L210DRAFT_3564313 [Boletus edulis BED1]
MGHVNGWHKGEHAIQHKMGYAGVMSQAWTQIEPEMPEQHQAFYKTHLPFIPVTTIDDRRRPWSSILAGRDGQPGFVTSQRLDELTLHAHVWEGDPFPQNVALGSRESPALIAGIGVEFSTRRRNKFAGYVEALEEDGPVLRVHSVVNEAIGECPKYINIRDLMAFSETNPRVVYRCLNLSPDERLPDDIVSFIHGSDALFFGTYYDAGEDGEQFLSHVGMNHRGGRPGFARIRPSDGRTLVIPDYSGNRLLTSLGNIEATPVAGATFVSFETGAVLYLTGDAHNLVGPVAQQLMPRINALTTIHATGYIFVEDALPVRQKPGTQVQRSPYSPPIQLLAEEITSTYFVDELQETPMTTLARIEVHSHDIATFTFESPTHVNIIPGQAAILDFKPFVGTLPYQHMAPENPMSVNDDRIRTWTVSRSSQWAGPFSESRNAGTAAGPTSFSLTIRHKPGGVVTSALFAITEQMGKFRPELLEDARPLQFSVPLVGVAGDFTLPTEADACVSGQGGGSSPCAGIRKWLWLAGGIGMTPFLAMLAGLREGHTNDIILVLSTREPDVLLALVTSALERKGDHVREHGRHQGTLSIHLFSRFPVSSSSSVATAHGTVLAVEMTHHPGRLNEDTLRTLNIEDVQERQAYVCGSESFERAVLCALKQVGVDARKVRKEGFVY